MTRTTFSPKISFQTRNSTKSDWKAALFPAKITFSRKISPQTEKSATNYWKVGLYTANFVFALLLIRYGKFFSDAITVPSSIVVISVFLFAGFTRLRHLGDGSRIKAYIKAHEAWVLILLTIFLIAGTMFYIAIQARIDAGTFEHPKITHS